ncbi:MAG: hypothetical protein RIS70_3371 [Planctomycetota bacterium]
MKKPTILTRRSFLKASAAEAKGVKFLRMENGRAVFEVPSGNYEFRSRL